MEFLSIEYADVVVKKYLNKIFLTLDSVISETRGARINLEMLHENNAK